MLDFMHRGVDFYICFEKIGYIKYTGYDILVFFGKSDQKYFVHPGREVCFLRYFTAFLSEYATCTDGLS